MAVVWNCACEGFYLLCWSDPEDYLEWGKLEKRDRQSNTMEAIGSKGIDCEDGEDGEDGVC